MDIVQDSPNQSVDPTPLYTTLAEKAVERAAEILQQAQLDIRPNEAAQAAKMQGMMKDPRGKTLTMVLSDQAFRSHHNARISNQIQYLLDKYGVPTYFSWWERAALKYGTRIGQFLPDLVVPIIVARLRQETRAVILPGEQSAFQSYANTRREGGTRLNINQLGEAILGEGEAERRFDAYLKLLENPDVEYVSVKISSVFSQINLVAFDETVTAIEERLRRLYRHAMQHVSVTQEGRKLPKFVNLDMEEYRDLHLTVEAFKRVLDEPEFFNYRAGIVLQAYLPDSAAVQRDLTAWALRRVEQGGAPIKLRIVKGANLAMERVEASIHDWEQAPYTTKADVDANYKRMVVYGATPERIAAVNLGIASHNLFDVAFALCLRDEYDLGGAMEFEMLEGMANHQARAVQAAADGMLLYAPIVKRADFHSAIAYLVRRLDENTAEQNFLHDLFGLQVGSKEWDAQRDRFLNAVRDMQTVRDAPRREQSRQTEIISFDPAAPFHNVADTDFSLRQNSQWIRGVRDQWQHAEIDPIPLQIGGEWVSDGFRGEGHDPADLDMVRYTYVLASAEQVNAALEVAVSAQNEWASRAITARKALLVRCAEEIANRRGDFIGVMMIDGGKRPAEADPEISEAIDFANYYARSFDSLSKSLKNNRFEPFGTVLVTPPWNFPLAIPAGGVLAALMAGNTVILKPAPEAVLTGWHLVNALWDAGIPKDVLQFVPTTDDAVGQSLVTDERVNAVILTGAYETGRMFQNWKPEMRLFAETSGKNSMIITSMADHDLAIKELVKSAFGHNGQKCSAASLAVLEAEVYDNLAFLRQLKDAAESLVVGSQWDLTSMVTPLISDPNPNLHRAFTTLEAGESWLLEPRMIEGQSNLWSPGIKLGVKRGSFYHKNECFGPVLGLICADDLNDAINIVNDSDFGLTSGIQSLDEREIAIWRERIAAGNAYINRGTTGAIVQRQPFGGWKKSVFGYAKAGGPNYVMSFGTWHEEDPTDSARESYQTAWHYHFSAEHDPSALLGETNHFRYVPIQKMIVRVTDGPLSNALKRITAACEVTGVDLLISAASALDIPDAITEDDAVFIQRLENLTSNDVRVRVLGELPQSVYEAANAAHVTVIDAPVLSDGRLELRHYMKEQSISETVHRYGNIFD